MAKPGKHLQGPKDLLVKLREQSFYAKTPMVLFTVSNSKDDKAFAESNRAGFITKPTGHTQMQEAVKDLLNRCLA